MSPFPNFLTAQIAFKTLKNYSNHAVDLDASGRRILVKYSRPDPDTP